jgi:RHS repeat-associated protein
LQKTGTFKGFVIDFSGLFYWHFWQSVFMLVKILCFAAFFMLSNNDFFSRKIHPDERKKMIIFSVLKIQIMHTTSATYGTEHSRVIFGEKPDHLGNVRAVVSDVRKPATTAGSIDDWTWKADVRFSANYYDGVGMIMPGTLYEGDGYRFGAQGSEVEKELDGTRNWITTYYRNADLTTMRWSSPDPKPSASWSPYAMMNGNPILFNDILGDTAGYFNEAESRYVWFDTHEEESFTDESGKTWNLITENKEEWNQAITIREGNIQFLIDMGYDEERVRQNVLLLGGEHDYFTKFSQLTTAEDYVRDEQWDDEGFSITGSGTISESTFSNRGFSIKYYQNKGEFQNINALGLVKSSFVSHVWETVWEILEIPLGDDVLFDMHFFNPFEYINNDYVNLMMQYTEIGYKVELNINR